VKLFDTRLGVLELAFDEGTKDEAHGGRLRGIDRAGTLATTAWAHGRVLSIAFSPDGTMLATAGEHHVRASGLTPGTLKLWDAKTGELKRDLEGHLWQAPSVAFSPDGKFLASAGQETNSPSGVRFWDPQTGELVRRLQSSRGDPCSLAFSPDGKLLAAGTIVHHKDTDSTTGSLIVWRVASGSMEVVRPLPASIWSVAFSPDGDTLATAGHSTTVMLWDPRTGKLKQEIQPVDRPGDQGRLCVAFSPQANMLAIGGRHADKSGFATTWDLERLSEASAASQQAGTQQPPPKNTAQPSQNAWLSQDATLDSILGRLKNPPQGWEVIGLGSRSGERAYRILLTRHGKRILVGVGQYAGGEKPATIYDLLRYPVRISALTSDTPLSVTCLKYGNTVVMFYAGDKTDRAFFDEAIRELGFDEGAQVPIWADLPKQHELRKKDHVQLVVGKERLTLEGKPTTWEKLRNMLEELPDRENSVLYIARTTDDWVISAWQEVEGRIHRACRGLEFEATSFIGVHPLGSKGTLSLRLVIAGGEDMTIDGRKTRLCELFDALLRIPERYRTVLEIVRASGGNEEITTKEWENLRGHAAMIASRLGFKGTTCIDDGSVGSKPSKDEANSEERAATAPTPATQAARDETSAGTEPLQFYDALEEMKGEYVVGLDRPELMEAALRDTVAEWGRHSGYVSPIELRAFMEQLERKRAGIGIELTFDEETRGLRVTTPLPWTPAYHAGIRARDTIVGIDGKPVSEFPQGNELETAMTLLRGKPGSAVTVGLKPFKSDEVRQIEIVREVIHLPAIKGDTLKPHGEWNFMLGDDRKIGYVRLMHFNSRSADELRDAVEELQSNGMMAFILDLRNNAGGMLSQAIQVADLFVEDGVIVSIKNRQEPGKTWFAKSEGTFGEAPMAVLVNRDSVAAAEIVAACLQDHGRAIIVGERTYGKGTAHKILELKGGDGALKLPTAIFLRPNGKGIHRFDGAEEWDPWGVVPDEKCEINLSEEEYGRFLEYRRQRDVFSPEGPPATDFVDRQLQNAIERL